jgi:hypothetical protein
MAMDLAFQAELIRCIEEGLENCESMGWQHPRCRGARYTTLCVPRYSGHGGKPRVTLEETMTTTTDDTHLRRLAIQIASQLPEDEPEALQVLEYCKRSWSFLSSRTTRPLAKHELRRHPDASSWPRLGGAFYLFDALCKY